jgi:DNA modification methylase
MNAPLVFLENRVTLYLGDVLAVLATLPEESVDCVVTSPPYWGLRDYGVEGQIGLEPTLGEHLDVMLAVFREIRRVLKKTGTLWVNYGDCYATSPNGRSAADTKAVGNDDRTFRDKPFSTVGAIYAPGYEKTARVGAGQNKGSTAAAHGGRVMAGGTLKPKDLCMVPNRLAIALQEDGWWVRSEIIWAKPNPMPESIRDRPATAHEKIFMLTKSERYWYDASAVRQGRASNEDANGFRGGSYVQGEPGARTSVGNVRKSKQRAADVAGPRHADGINHTGIEDVERGSRNLRNYEPAPLMVWLIATKPFSEAHFATFPPELAERCILAGCPKGGLVLDPFGGAGTTALVAARHARRAALIELNPEYAAIARRRIEAEWKVPVLPPQATDFGPLFSIQEAAE